MTCNHSWYQSPTEPHGWKCWECSLELTDEAVNLLRFQGHIIEMDYERLNKEL